MLGSFNALCDYRPTLSTPNVRGRRLALATSALRSPPMHRRTAFNEQVSWLFVKMTRVLRRSGVIDRSRSFAIAQATSSMTVAYVERHRGRQRFSIRVKHRIASQICLIGITKKSRSLMTNIRIIMSIFVRHIEKHESVSLFLQNEPRTFKCTKDKLTTSSYSLANYGVVL